MLFLPDTSIKELTLAGSSKSSEAASTSKKEASGDNDESDDDDDADLIGPPIPKDLLPDDSVKKSSSAETGSDGDEDEDEPEEVSSYRIKGSSSISYKFR